MYSVIYIKGHQYKVEPGQSIVVDKLDSQVDQIVSYPSLLFVDGQTVKVGKEAASLLVRARVIRHFKGDKIDVRRFRAKSRYRRHIGFRPYFTELKIEEIGVNYQNKLATPSAGKKPVKKTKSK